MLEAFAAYFREIEMTDVLRDRAERVCLGFAVLIPGGIDRVFVTDGYDREGVRRYQSLWLTSGNLIMEIKNFVESDNIDFVNLACGVRWLQVDKTALDNAVGETTIRSRVTVQIMFGEGVGGVAHAALGAAHNNCVRLIEFVQAVFMPRLA